MNRINLLPDHFIARRRRARLVTRLAVAGVFAAVGAGAWGVAALSQLGELSTRVAASQARLAQEQARSGDIETRAAEGRTLRGMLAHRGQLETPVASAGVLTLLTHLLPDSVALTRLSLEVPPADMTNRGGPAAAAAAPAAARQPTRVVLEGLALSDVELTQVVSALAGQRAFTNVKLVRSRQVPVGAVTRFGFEITLDVPAAVAAAAAPASASAAGKAAGGEGERGA